MFQIIGAFWVFILLSIPFRGERFYIWFIKWITFYLFRTDNPARQIAMGFTFMPIINHILVFPNLKFIVKLFNRIFPERETPKPFGIKYIKKKLISQNIDLALLMTKKEILRVGDFISEMIIEMNEAFHSKDSAIIDRVSKLDSRVDILHSQIILYLASISQEELSDKQSSLCMNYMYIQNELESIGDVIDKNIMSLAAKKIDQNIVFSVDGFHELEHLIYRVNRNYHILIKGLKEDDLQHIEQVLDFHKKKEEEKYKRLHIQRLYDGKADSIASSSVHLDLISYFSKINNHIAYVAKRLRLLY